MFEECVVVPPHTHTESQAKAGDKKNIILSCLFRQVFSFTSKAHQSGALTLEGSTGIIFRPTRTTAMPTAIKTEPNSIPPQKPKPVALRTRSVRFGNRTRSISILLSESIMIVSRPAQAALSVDGSL
jgi:hypothetical protein